MSAHTPGPWKLGEFDEHLGYDCMTGGIRSGPAVLDGRDYGQKSCEELDLEAKAKMLADAALIAAAPDLLEALKALAASYGRIKPPGHPKSDAEKQADAAIKKAEAAQ